MKRSFMAYFKFTKKEFNGLLVLMFLILVVSSIPLFHDFFHVEEVYDFRQFEKEINAFNASASKYRPYSYKDLKDKIEDREFDPVYFDFDPNGLPVDKWKQLGLSAYQIKIIKNYEAKGGKFYRKEDLRKIYSIKPEDYQRLEPYIVIPSSADKYPVYTQREYKSEIKKVISVDLNTADSAQLDQLKGIGPTFANRILKYRNRLGGFYDVEQLREIYGMDSAKFDALKSQIKLSHEDIRKININTATFEELKSHPYLTFKQMNAIINYRKQHGNYKSIADLKKVLLLNDEILRKIEPYLEF